MYGSAFAYWLVTAGGGWLVSDTESVGRLCAATVLESRSDCATRTRGGKCDKVKIGTNHSWLGEIWEQCAKDCLPDICSFRIRTINLHKLRWASAPRVFLLYLHVITNAFSIRRLHCILNYCIDVCVFMKCIYKRMKVMCQAKLCCILNGAHALYMMSN